MSMLSSVFGNRRKGIQRKLNSLTHIKRAQSPPSPASFASPDLGDRAFNPYILYNSSASQQSVNQPSFTFTPSTTNVTSQADTNNRQSSPKVQLEFPVEGLSLSDWFPAELLQLQSDTFQRVPERNASLGVTGPGSSSLSVHTLASHGASTGSISERSGHTGMPAGRAMSKVDEQSGENEHDQEHDSTNNEHDFSHDDVIVIEAPRGRDPTLSPLASSFIQQEDSPSRQASVSQQGRRPAPLPIKIPNNASSAKIQVEHSQPGSAFPSHKAAERAQEDVGPTRTVSRHQSLVRSRHTSLTRSRSRINSRSRPNSMYSRYSDTDVDLDDGLSAVSGTTLARALVASYILSPSPNASSPPVSHAFPRSRGHLARQDSATLPRGEYSFLFNRKSVRSSKGSVLSNSGIGSTYWRDRKISGDQIVVLSPEERENWSSDVPPVPPMPEGLSPEPSATFKSVGRRSKGQQATLHRSQTSSIANVDKETGTDQKSQPNDSNRGDPDADATPDSKRRRLSRPSDHRISHLPPPSRTQSPVPVEQERPSDTGEDLSSRNGPLTADSESSSQGQDVVVPVISQGKHLRSPDAPTTATSESISIYSDETHLKSAGSGSVYSGATSSPGLTSALSYSSPGSSSVHTPGSTGSSQVRSRDHTFRSFSESRTRRNDSPSKLPVSILPIGERPRSAQVPHSPSSPVTFEGARPQSMLSPFVNPSVVSSPNRNSIDSPDLLDIMFAGSRVSLLRSVSSGAGTRLGSPPAPISVPSRTFPSTPSFELVQTNSNSPSIVRQTFPETPYAFTPLGSSGFASPSLPAGVKDVPPPLPRAGTISVRGTRVYRITSGLPRKALIRSATLTSPPASLARSFDTEASATSLNLDSIDQRPAVPALTMDDAAVVVNSEPAGGILSAIEEDSTPVTPMSTRSSYILPHEGSARLDAKSEAEMRPPSRTFSRQSLRSLTPSMVALPASPQLSSPSSPVSPRKRKYGSMSDPDELPVQIPINLPCSGRSTPSVAATPSPSALTFPQLLTPDRVSLLTNSQPLASYGTITPKRSPRTRPPPPIGPRKLSQGTQLGRGRASSVSSLHSSTSNAVGASTTRTMSISSSTPTFRSSPIKFRGLTMEAAQWTFTSQELQYVVSTAIRNASEASAIRLLTSENVDVHVPEEIRRLETLSVDLKTNYKLGIRKRAKLMNILQTVIATDTDTAASMRYLEELAELSDSLDRTAEELYRVTDQLGQLTHLRDVHASSALSMALRKLNSSFRKHLADNQTLRQQVVMLEEEREEAWKLAQDAAKELDSLNDKMAHSEGMITPASSRRSSQVIVARKFSSRRAGLRSPSRLRSQRSSVASRSSMAGSPAVRTASTGEYIPPVPPIPMRTPLGVMTSGLSSNSSALTSGVSPTSEMRAMVKAQKEICEMLGISPDDLAEPSPSIRPRSMSAAHIRANEDKHSFQRPRSSSGVFPSQSSRSNDAWQSHHRSRSAGDDRS